MTDLTAGVVDLEEAECEAYGWNRLLCNYQGQEAGWLAAAETILDEATAAWRAGDEKKAALLRAISESLRSHRRLASIKQEQSDAYKKQVAFEERSHRRLASIKQEQSDAYKKQVAFEELAEQLQLRKEAS